MNIKINQNVFEAFPNLESPRLLLSEMKDHDKSHLKKLRSDERVMTFMDSNPIKNDDEALTRIQSQAQDFKEMKGINWKMTLKTNGDFMGDAGFWRIDHKNCRGEIGYALLPQFWGKGYMKEALITIINYAFNEMGFHGIDANVNTENAASFGLLEKLGFRKEAHFKENYLFNGRYLDSLIYCIVEGDWKFDNHRL